MITRTQSPRWSREYPCRRLSPSGNGGSAWWVGTGLDSLLYPSPLSEPDVRHCRVAQPLLAFAPTEPTVRRYRSGLFRADLRRIDHLCQACWITGSGSGKAVRSFVVGCPGHTAFLAAFAEHLVTRFG